MKLTDMILSAKLMTFDPLKKTNFFFPVQV